MSKIDIEKLAGLDKLRKIVNDYINTVKLIKQFNFTFRITVKRYL